MADNILSYCADQVRRHDRGRFLTALFAPGEAREGLFALYAFNIELARAREVVTEPLLGRIRLQWWRETITELYDGKPRRHQVVDALAALLARRPLPRDLFERMIDAREEDLEEGPPASGSDLQAYADSTAGALARLATGSLGAERDGKADQAAGLVGRAHGIAGILSSIGFRAGLNRIDLPRDLLDRHGVAPANIRAYVPDPGLAASVRELAEEATRTLAEARLQWGRDRSPALPALLIGTLADRALTRLAKAGWNPFQAPANPADPTLPLLLWWRARAGRL